MIFPCSFKVAYVRTLIRVLATIALSCSTLPLNASADEGRKDALLRYAKHAIKDDIEKYRSNHISISFFNPPHGHDGEAVALFSHTMFWASGTHANLSIGPNGKLVIVYLEDFQNKAEIKFDDEILQKMYDSGLETLKQDGHCTKLVAKNQNDDKIKSVLFIDKNADSEERISCIYKNYRAEYGIDERHQLSKFGDTFIADLRILRCRELYHNKDAIITNMEGGAC